MAVEEFRVGRACIKTGSPRNDIAGSPKIKVQAGDLLDISGTWAPDEQESDNAIRLAASDAFKQQWLGMAEQPDVTVPIVAPERFGIDGFYFPVATTITDLPTVSKTRGVVDFAGQFRRLQPAFSQAGEGLVGTLQNRSKSVHNVSAAGQIWWPFPSVWEEPYTFDPTGSIKVSANGSGATAGTISGIRVVDGNTGTNLLQQVAFAVKPEQVYIGSCEVERQDPNTGEWFTMAGRQVPTVPDPRNIRISNGLVRGSFGFTGGFIMEAFSQTGETWGEAGKWVFGGYNPTGPPVVQVNTREYVSVRYPVISSGGIHAFADYSIRRGDRWVDVSIVATLAPAQYNITEYSGLGGVSGLGGMWANTANPAGHKWIIIAPGEDTGASNPGTSTLRTNAQSEWGFGVNIDSDTGFFAITATIQDYWKIKAYTNYPIAL